MCSDQEIAISVMNSVKEFLVEMKEENDRAIVIVGAANVDDLLKSLIEHSLLPPLNKKQDELLSDNSPISSFSSRINLCYRLGLIDKQLCQLLHILKKLRNDFAHKVRGCDLNSSPHSDMIGTLTKHFEDSLQLEKIRDFFPGNLASSRDFRIMLALISSLLEMKLRYLPKTLKANPVSISWIAENIKNGK